MNLSVKILWMIWKVLFIAYFSHYLITVIGEKGNKMKRYDLAGQVRQFGAKQFWVVKLNSRFDVWVSYDTAVAIVDHLTHEVIEGAYARGFSRTTTKQVTQAYGEFARGYFGAAYDSYRYHEFNREHSCVQINKWKDEWGRYNACSAATYYLAEVLK